MKQRIVSGIQPTGPLHLGNYLGAVKHWLELQKTKGNECLFFIADYHSLTENYSVKEKYNQVLELGAELLALGLDPKKSILFIQSQVPQVTELAWIFNCITPISFLERMTQYKDKSARQAQNINTGLFDYPVLQAADILVYRGEAVPVGTDQIQHVELASDIARFFNRRFGEYFKSPKPLLTAAPKIMSLLEPEKKMSKSLGYDHCIFLSDSPEEIKRKIKRAVTDIGPVKIQNPAVSPGVENLFLLLENFGSETDVKRFKNDYKSGAIRYSDLKDAVAIAVSGYFSDFRRKKEELLNKPENILKIYLNGGKKAQKIASQTLEEVRKMIGLRK